MKNVTLTFILILFFLSSLSFAQYYVKFEGGYNLSINSMLIALNETFTSGTTIKYENVNGSFGRGVNISGAFGYTFSSNVGLELGLIYKLSTEFEGNTPTAYNINVTWNGSFFGFAPTFVINAPLDKVKAFAKMGLLIPLPSSEFDFVNDDGTSGNGVFSGGLDFGLTGGAGVLVPISTQINFMAEVVFVSYTWKPDEIEVTHSDGTTYTIKLEDEFTSDDGDTQASQFIPFSNIGLNIGVQIGL